MAVQTAGWGWPFMSPGQINEWVYKETYSLGNELKYSVGDILKCF